MPEIDTDLVSGYDVGINESAGGKRYANIFNTTVRRNWKFDYKYINSTEKTHLETMRDSVYMGDICRYPFYFSDDSETTLYLVRSRNRLKITEHAYQQWQTTFEFEEEL